MNTPNNDQTTSESPSPRTTCSAVVTRYPTGCFGIDHNGSMFYWWGFEEEAVHAELKRLRIPADRVEWQERYYDRTFDFNDPRSCRTRPFIPQNTQAQATRPAPQNDENKTN